MDPERLKTLARLKKLIVKHNFTSEELGVPHAFDAIALILATFTFILKLSPAALSILLLIGAKGEITFTSMQTYLQYDYSTYVHNASKLEDLGLIASSRFNKDGSLAKYKSFRLTEYGESVFKAFWATYIKKLYQLNSTTC